MILGIAVTCVGLSLTIVGKSTKMEHTIYKALCNLRHIPAEHYPANSVVVFVMFVVLSITFISVLDQAQVHIGFCGN